METIAATPFLTMVGWSVVILVLHINLQASLSTLELGSAWNAGPRDEEKKPKGALAGRAARASENFLETYPAFIALALALAIMGDSSGWGMTGAWTWMIARIIYAPLYLAGVPYMRSLVWIVSLLGLAMMFFVVVG